MLFMHWHVQMVLVSELTRKFKGPLCMIYAIGKWFLVAAGVIALKGKHALRCLSLHSCNHKNNIRNGFLGPKLV